MRERESAQELLHDQRSWWVPTLPWWVPTCVRERACARAGECVLTSTACACVRAYVRVRACTYAHNTQIPFALFVELVFASAVVGFFRKFA